MRFFFRPLAARKLVYFAAFFERRKCFLLLISQPRVCLPLMHEPLATYLSASVFTRFLLFPLLSTPSFFDYTLNQPLCARLQGCGRTCARTGEGRLGSKREWGQPAGNKKSKETR